MEAVDRSYLKFLRVLGFVEGVSTLLLFFIAMPLKYAAGFPAAVTVAGSVHGLLFSGLVFALFIAIDKVPLPAKLSYLGILAAVVPFGPFLFDRKLVRIGECSAE